MSLLLDALRKGRGAERTPAAQSAHADSVLATLGYGTTLRARTSGVPVVLGVVAAVVLLGLATLWLWPTFFPSDSAGNRAAGAAQAHGPAGPTRTQAPTNVYPLREAPPRSPAAPALEQPRTDASPEPQGEPSPEPSRDPVRIAASDFRLALYYQRAGDFERALAHYRAVLERNELNAEVHNNLGLLYQQKGLLDESASEFQRATFINPRYARAHSNLGVTLMRQGKLDLATAEFELASSLDSRDVDARVNLALAQKASRRAEMAKTTLVNALAIDPSAAAAHYNLALLYDESGETTHAIEHYRAFLDHAGVEHASLAPDVRARIEKLQNPRTPEL